MPTEQDYRTCAKDGLTPRETALKLHVTRITVYRRAKKLNIHFAYDDAWKQDNLDTDLLYKTSCANGATITQLARLLHVKRNTVIKRAKRLGLTFAGQTYRRSSWPSDTDYRTCQAQGLTTTETAHRLKVSRETVRKRSYKLNIQFARSSKQKRTVRRCTPRGCPQFHQCKKRIADGHTALCEKQIDILDQPEELLWSHNGGHEAITDYY